MSPEEKNDLLRKALDDAWCSLGQFALKSESIGPESIDEICDKIADALNDTDPDLEGIKGRNRGIYAHYQPMEVLRFISKPREKTLTIEPKPLPEYHE